MVQCQQCNKTFARAATLKRHVKTKHVKSELQHKCLECHQLFVRRDHFSRHYEYAHGDGRTACSNCSRTFRPDYLKQHERTCVRKRRLPGAEIILNAGPRNNAKRKPVASDPEALQQCLQATLEPTLILRNFNDEVTLLTALPPHLADGSDPAPIGPALYQPQPPELAHIGAEHELTTDEYADITQSLWQGQSIHDKKGRIRLSSWSSQAESYATLPQFLVTAITDIKQYCPDLNVLALVEQFYFDPVEEKVFEPQPQGRVPPASFELYMLPCIRCLDCHISHIVTNLTNVFRDFNLEHAMKPPHGQNLRGRLIHNSITIRELAYEINKDDDREPSELIDRLVEGDMSTEELEESYQIFFSKSIYESAYHKNERNLLAYLFDDFSSLEGDRLSWARASDDPEIVKMALYCGYVDIFGRSDHGQSTVLYRLVHEQRIPEAVKLVEFAAFHNYDGAALVLACRYAPEEVIASLLQAGADPDKLDEDGECALGAALECAGVNVARMLLNAGANVRLIAKPDIKNLTHTVWDGESPSGANLHRDAAEKLELLKQHGIRITIHQYYVYESDDSESG